MLWEDICGWVAQIGSLRSSFGFTGDELPSLAEDSFYIWECDQIKTGDEMIEFHST